MTNPRNPLPFGELDAMSRADHTVLMLLIHALGSDVRDKLASRIEELIDPNVGQLADSDDLFLDEFKNWISLLRT